MKKMNSKKRDFELLHTMKKSGKDDFLLKLSAALLKSIYMEQVHYHQNPEDSMARTALSTIKVPNTFPIKYTRSRKAVMVWL